MKLIIILAMAMTFTSCHITGLNKSICEGKSRNLKGFTGRYYLDIDTGSGRKVPVKIKRVTRGKYQLVIKGDGGSGELLTYSACKIGRAEVLEVIDEDSGMILLKKLIRTRDGLRLEGIVLDQAALKAAGIAFTVETESSDWVEMTTVLVENQNVDPKLLLSMEAPVGTAEPFTIPLTRR